MAVTEGPLLSERQFDRLVDIVPDLTAKQLWNIAEAFDCRIVALSEGGTAGGESSVEHAGEQRIGFWAE